MTNDIAAPTRNQKRTRERGVLADGVFLLNRSRDTAFLVTLTGSVSGQLATEKGEAVQDWTRLRTFLSYF